MSKKMSARRASKKAVEKVLDTSKKGRRGKTPKAEQPEVKAEATKPNVGRTKYTDKQRITIKKEYRDANPKRPGSEQHRLWALYKDGMTVGEFGAAVGNHKVANHRLRFDVKRGFVTVK
jgi:hypothetical protein